MCVVAFLRYSQILIVWNGIDIEKEACIVLTNISLYNCQFMTIPMKINETIHLS